MPIRGASRFLFCERSGPERKRRYASVNSLIYLSMCSSFMRIRSMVVAKRSIIIGNRSIMIRNRSYFTPIALSRPATALSPRFLNFTFKRIETKKTQSHQIRWTLRFISSLASLMRCVALRIHYSTTIHPLHTDRCDYK